ncbi:zinc finger protein Xfin-like [Limulus polyphemus]|uniref:Zinc finger protein Xfin-like n=1 Tax=Limulus polyphemus TaxID=6850 RepID=A0ABM1B6Z9_LIMPO|nr:zinc finger protein Xfin-like [Limulus polyphemus]XP_022243376.1 zinc finger protein Xfin-like [Limulus polyphemus]XP_022243377.1 zinc finger protein Xfin-like [Limulus polyphemus]XP_022243378.1 zinc finger protein Xfin-like [Limulus polyphemus]
MEKKVQGKNPIKNTGNSQESTNNNTSSNFEELDHSLLQTPLNLGTKDIRQILHCLQSGTREVRDIILNECSIIYECKVCRNMFRSLANLLAHKRFYCKKHLCESMVLLFENPPEEVITVQPESPKEEEQNKNYPDMACKPEDINSNDQVIDTCVEPIIQLSVPKIYTPTKEAAKSIGGVVSPGPGKDHTSSHQEHTSKEKELPMTESSVYLQPIFGNSNAMMQTIKPLETLDNKNSEKLENISEEREMPTKEEDTVVIPDVLPHESTAKEKNHVECFVSPTHSSSRAKQLANRTDCDIQTLTCLRCETHYASISTLYYHMTRIHAEKRIVYPCMFCNSTFVQIWGLTRHLTHNHQKTKAQLKELKKQVKCYSYEETRNRNFQDGKKRKELDSSENTNNINNKLQLHTCYKCGRKFMRKSSQLSHELYCSNQFRSVGDKIEQQIKPSTGISVTPNVISRPKRVAEKKVPEDFVNSQTLFRRGWKHDKKSPSKMTQVNNEPFQNAQKFIDIKNVFCKKCHRRFSSVSNLKRHVAVHAGVRRFKCKLCSYQSYTKSDCRIHIQRMHSKPNSTQDVLEKLIIDLPVNTPVTQTALTKIEEPETSPKKLEDSKQTNLDVELWDQLQIFDNTKPVPSLHTPEKTKEHCVIRLRGCSSSSSLTSSNSSPENISVYRLASSASTVIHSSSSKPLSNLCDSLSTLVTRSGIYKKKYTVSIPSNANFKNNSKPSDNSESKKAPTSVIVT